MRLVLSTVILLGTLASSLAAQDLDPDKAVRRRDLLEGTHLMRRILFDHEFEALDDYNALADKPEQTLLVVLGDLQVLDQVPGGLEAFIRQGGALLAASDRSVRDPARRELLAVSGVSINHEKLKTSRLNEAFEALDYCPVVVSVPEASPALFQDAGITGPVPLSVYTNLPSRLVERRLPNGVQRLAMFPRGMLVETIPDFFVPDRDPHPSLFAVGGDVGRGRVLVLADHSVFINQMMLPHNTGNVEFTYNAVRWLQGQEPKRTRVLFVEDGHVRTQLDIPLKSITLPLEDMLKLMFLKRNEVLATAGETIKKLEDEDWFNNKLFDAFANAGLSPDMVVRNVLILASMAALVYFIYRLGIRSRFRHETNVPLLYSSLGRALPETPLVAQREQAMIQQRNLWEPATALARRWFVKLGVDAATAAEPTFTATGSWWSRRRLLRQLRRLWRLAAGQAARRVTPAELWRLQRELEGLKRGWERGAWRIAS